MKISVKNKTRVRDLKPGDVFAFGDSYLLIVEASPATIPCHESNLPCLDLQTNRICFMGKNLDVVQYGIEIILTGYSF